MVLYIRLLQAAAMPLSAMLAKCEDKREQALAKAENKLREKV